MSIITDLTSLQQKVRVSLLANAAKYNKEMADAVEVCLRQPTGRHRAVMRRDEEIDGLFVLWEDLEYTIHNYISRTS